jgi:uncharacterized protein YceH (UPF0502 family)
MRRYQSIDREEPAAHGQRRVWARVGRGEVIMVKVPGDADEAHIESVVNAIIDAEEAVHAAQPTITELQQQIAELQAQLQSLGAGGDS